MSILNLQLYLEDDISEDLSECQFKKPMPLNFLGQEWEIIIESASSLSDGCGEDYFNFHRFARKSKVYNITGTVSNKSAKEIRKAKEDVRQKQQEFKKAQRKLSELMGNKEV